MKTDESAYSHGVGCVGVRPLMILVYQNIIFEGGKGSMVIYMIIRIRNLSFWELSLPYKEP